MTKVSYKIIEHDGGWAYKVGDVFSETFPSHDEAHRAAERAAREQVVPGEATSISWRTRTVAGTTDSLLAAIGPRRTSWAEERLSVFGELHAPVARSGRYQRP